MEIFNPHSNIDFLRLRKVSISISILLIVIALGAIFTKGLNYGLDFTGGVLVEVEYQNPVEIGDVRNALTDAGFKDAQVVSAGGVREVSIRLQNRESKSDVKAGDAKAPDAKAGDVKAGDAKAIGSESKSKSDQLAADVLKALQAKRSDAKMKQDPDIV